VDQAVTTTGPQPDGLVASHFHLSVDGTQVLNFAERISDQAHQKTIVTSGPAVRDLPSFKTLTFERFQLRLQLADVME
jgi:hypothetical protein